ncbi:MAG: hypothetical protein O3C40_33320 [Planctomycetota bacterium]|nr:hypothetical protein [Planctomycetota bacterium]
MPTKEYSEQFVNAAKQVYASHREELESKDIGKVIGIEPESGEYVIGATFLEVDRKSQDRFGTKPVFFTRVGGGGAVRIPGVRVA